MPVGFTMFRLQAAFAAAMPKAVKELCGGPCLVWLLCFAGGCCSLF